MRTAYFDCFSGAAGDMLLGALLHAGCPLKTLQDVVAKLGIPDVALETETVKRHGIAAVKAHVRVGPGAQTKHRHLPEIERIIRAAALSERVTANALRVFQRLAEAEATVHGTSVEKVHFHEVGAADAIVDIVGVCAALDALRVERIVCSTLVTGSGTVKCEHGVMPVPAPATALLLRDVPSEAGPERGEQLTPTGAALLTTLAADFGPLPELRLAAVGYGAGTRVGEQRPNLVRVMLGESGGAEAGEVDEVVVLEAQLDDLTPEALAFATERLWEAGAVDVVTAPITMKKGRAGQMLTVLAPPAAREQLVEALLTHTSSFGVRVSSAQRRKLRREHVHVRTLFGDVRVKLGRLGDRIVQVAPEYEDCAAAARAAGVPLSAVQQAAREAYQREHRTADR